MLDPHDGGAAGVNFANGLHQFTAFMLGQPAGDLVEQQKLRLDRQRPRQLQPLALQQGQRPRRYIGFVIKSGRPEHVAAAPVTLALGRAPAEDGADQKVLEHAHVGERMRDLIRAADTPPRAAMRRHHGHIGAVEQDAAAARRDVAGDQVEQRGLAGAVGADDRERLAAFDGKVHRVHGLERPVRLGHSGELEEDRHGQLRSAAGAIP